MRVLIFTCFKSIEKFQGRVDNRTLLWGLDEANIEWQLINPWNELPDLFLFDAVISTLHAPRYRNYIFHCARAEEKCKAAGIPVINSCARYSPSHSYFMKRWSEEGINCARFQHFTDFKTVTLPYPLILRVDGVHRGLSMYFANNEEEALRAIDTQNELHHRLFPSYDCPAPLDIAIEFVDTKKDDGFYEKKRCYVVGDQIIPAHLLRSVTPFVNYKDSLLDPVTCALDKQYTLLDEFTDDSELIMKAAKATGFEIITLDYSICSNGEYVFWEGNRRRATAGDARIKWLGIRPPDILYGNAVAELVKKTIAARTTVSPQN